MDVVRDAGGGRDVEARLMEASPATLAALRWLARRGTESEFSGGSLVSYYRERSGNSYATMARMHAWRRTGGAVLRRAQEAGLVRRRRTVWGTPHYVFTAAGREAVRDA